MFDNLGFEGLPNPYQGIRHQGVISRNLSRPYQKIWQRRMETADQAMGGLEPLEDHKVLLPVTYLLIEVDQTTMVLINHHNQLQGMLKLYNDAC